MAHPVSPTSHTCLHALNLDAWREEFRHDRGQRPTSTCKHEIVCGAIYQHHDIGIHVHQPQEPDMSDPTTHNQLYEAGRRAFQAGNACTPDDDPVVRTHTSGLPIGDQLAWDLKNVWIHGFEDAHAQANETAR